MYAGIMYRAGNTVLLMKRIEGVKMGGFWSYPAGRIEATETPEQAAKREFAEETGKVIEAELFQVSPDDSDFALFVCNGGMFDVRMNDEHSEYMWADSANLPTPLHPGISEQIAACAMDGLFSSSRRPDQNGFITIFKNPISKSGVFPYLGRSLPGADDPNKVYGVLRPAEEIADREAIDSFKMIPIIDDHVMLGEGYPTAPEEKGVHGSTGEDVFFEGDTLYSNLRIFSNTLKNLIDSGKKGLSLGYRCIFEKSAGVFNGMPYDYIQRQIRGNHLALVNEGRMGTVVLDHHFALDHFDLALDTQGEPMADVENKDIEVKDESGGDSEKKEMSLAEISQALSTLMPFMAKVQEFMTSATPKLDEASVLDGDTEEKPGDQAEDEDEDDKEKSKKEKDEAMDANEIGALKSRLSNIEANAPKAFLSEIANRDKLAREVSAVVGTFDHSEMTTADVVNYAVKKLNIEAEKGHERAALTGFLAGRKSTVSVAFAMDAKIKPEGLLAKRLNGAKA